MVAVYAILLKYHVPLERIDELKEQHLAHIDRQVEDGLFVLGGRLVPRTGGLTPQTYGLSTYEPNQTAQTLSRRFYRPATKTW